MPDVAVILQRLAPDLAASLWRVHELCELPLDVRGPIADVLVCEAAERGPDEDEEPNAYAASWASCSTRSACSRT